ncbi:MAG: hypothetical protein LWW93_17440 [Hyphomicrobiales bacterium]|nr:hypothetical protein [Hyphomicrobiales bacterium]
MRPTSRVVALSLAISGAFGPIAAGSEPLRIAATFDGVEAAVGRALATGQGAPSTSPLPDGGVSSDRPPVSDWRAPKEDGGLKPMPDPGSPVLFSNGSIGATHPGALAESSFVLSRRTWIAQVMTYHYGARKRPGTIALRRDDGMVIGPWQAAGAGGQGNVPWAYWWAQPGVTLEPGRYVVVDSDPATWSWEDVTRGAGIFKVWGRPVR